MRCRECRAELPLDARFCLSCGTRVEAAAPAAASDPLLEALDKAIGFQYRIERLLGRGGMGAVYLAHELALDRDVAIKVLPPNQAGTVEVRERFKREARTAARLSHPNIVPLHTFGEANGLLYFVMGYVAGESLADRLQRAGPYEAEAARSFLAAVCDALDYAHRQGIVHRDIKPDNILIDAESGAPRLTDFGIAKAPLTDANLTTAGQLIGTPYYMSPEQAMGRSDVGPPSDLYSLGVVAFEMVSGQLPFRAATPLDALTQRLTQAPAPISSVASHVPPDLAQVINRCLLKEAGERWPDAKRLRDALIPTDQDVEELQAVRILRTVTTITLPLAAVVFVYLALVRAFNPDSLPLRRITFILSGGVIGMLMLGIVMTTGLLRQGFGTKNLLATILQQPRWARSWYPRAWRRPGDVWDRLPREFRQSRAYRGLFRLYLVTVYFPLLLILSWDDRLLTLRAALTIVSLAGLVALFALRRRAMKNITGALRTTNAEALAILNTPSWRVTAWRRAPAAALLAGSPPAPATAAPEVRSAATRLATAAEDDDERSTRMS